MRDRRDLLSIKRSKVDKRDLYFPERSESDKEFRNVSHEKEVNLVNEDIATLGFRKHRAL